jgi:hypothetical protein
MQISYAEKVDKNANHAKIFAKIKRAIKQLRVAKIKHDMKRLGIIWMDVCGTGTAEMSLKVWEDAIRIFKEIKAEEAKEDKKNPPPDTKRHSIEYPDLYE